MASQTAQNEIVPLSQWSVESLRATLFLTGPPIESEPSWWRDLLDQSPEATISKPAIPAFQQEGPFGKGRLVLQLQPGRIDWLLNSLPSEEDGRFPRIGPYAEIAEPFDGTIAKWLPTSPPANRIAYGVILTHTINSRVAGYELLARFLKDSVRIDVENSSDFSYQINRPRRSSAGPPELRVNRLSRWSAAAIRSVRFALNAEKTGQSQAITREGDHSCRLEMDINTVPDYQKELPKDSIGLLYRELASFAKEIAVRGDIP